jgi:hypothetical protein
MSTKFVRLFLGSRLCAPPAAPLPSSSPCLTGRLHFYVKAIIPRPPAQELRGPGLSPSTQGHVKVRDTRVMGDVPGGALWNLRGPVSAERSAGAAENSRCLRPEGPSFGNSNPAAGGKRPRTGRDFTQRAKGISPHYRDQGLIRHFDAALPISNRVFTFVLSCAKFDVTVAERQNRHAPSGR